MHSQVTLESPVIISGLLLKSKKIWNAGLIDLQLNTDSHTRPNTPPGADCVSPNLLTHTRDEPLI